MKTVMLILLLSSTAAWAEEPSEATKTWALKRAYQLNGNSMVGFGASIDLTDEIKGITDPGEFNVLDATPVAPPAVPSVPAAPRRKLQMHVEHRNSEPEHRNSEPESNICTRHHLRKVNYGDSWKCVINRTLRVTSRPFTGRGLKQRNRRYTDDTALRTAQS